MKKKNKINWETVRHFIGGVCVLIHLVLVGYMIVLKISGDIGPVTWFREHWRLSTAMVVNILFAFAMFGLSSKDKS